MTYKRSVLAHIRAAYQQIISTITAVLQHMSQAQIANCNTVTQRKHCQAQLANRVWLSLQLLSS